MMRNLCVKSLAVRRYFLLITLVHFVASCDGATGPSGNKPSVTVVAGAGVTDTIEAQLAQALVVEVRGAGGRLVSGALVRFESRPPSDPAQQFESAVYVCQLSAQTCFSSFLADTTDRTGRVKAVIRLGTVAGKAVVRLTVPEFGVQDSATFTVTPGAPARIVLSPRDTTLDIGGTVTIQTHTADRHANARSEVATLSAGAGDAVTVSPASNTVTARDMGTQSVYAQFGAVKDSAIVRVLPAGRLVVWSPSLQVVRLVNINGKDERTLLTNVASEFGVFPRFDPTRQRVTLHMGSSPFGPHSNAIVLDTTGAARRDVMGFTVILAVRQTDDGNLMVVGARSIAVDAYHLYRVTADNTITMLATLTGFFGADAGVDIAFDGNRVAYIAGGSLNVLDVSTGVTTTLDHSVRAPRWSVQGDRLVYLVPSNCFFDPEGGVATVINPDGSGRRILADSCFSPGLSWSPDGKYVIGRSIPDFAPYLRIVRVSDGADVLARFVSGNTVMDYFQPDWR